MKIFPRKCADKTNCRVISGTLALGRNNNSRLTMHGPNKSESFGNLSFFIGKCRQVESIKRRTISLEALRSCFSYYFDSDFEAWQYFGHNSNELISRVFGGQLIMSSWPISSARSSAVNFWGESPRISGLITGSTHRHRSLCEVRAETGASINPADIAGGKINYSTRMCASNLNIYG